MLLFKGCSRTLLLCVQPRILGCFPKTPVRLPVLSLENLHLEILSAYGMSANLVCLENRILRNRI